MTGLLLGLNYASLAGFSSVRRESIQFVKQSEPRLKDYMMPMICNAFKRNQVIKPIMRIKVQTIINLYCTQTVYKSENQSFYK